MAHSSRTLSLLRTLSLPQTCPVKLLPSSMKFSPQYPCAIPYLCVFFLSNLLSVLLFISVVLSLSSLFCLIFVFPLLSSCVFPLLSYLCLPSFVLSLSSLFCLIFVFPLLSYLCLPSFVFLCLPSFVLALSSLLCLPVSSRFPFLVFSFVFCFLPCLLSCSFSYIFPCLLLLLSSTPPPLIEVKCLLEQLEEHQPMNVVVNPCLFLTF